MIDPSDRWTGVERAEVLSREWVSLAEVPSYFAWHLPDFQRQCLFKLDDELSAANAEADWQGGDLVLSIPARAREEFSRDLGVAATSNGDGVLWLWGSPTEFLDVKVSVLETLTSADVARAVVAGVAVWWETLTTVAMGALQTYRWPLIEGVVARLGSPLATRFTEIPLDALNVLTVSDWRKGTAISPCGANLYALHLVPGPPEAEVEQVDSPSEPNNIAPTPDRGMGSRALLLLRQAGVSFENPNWVALASQAVSLSAKSSLRWDLSRLTPDMLRMAHVRWRHRHSQT